MSAKQQHKHHTTGTAAGCTAMMRCCHQVFAIALILDTIGKRDFIFSQGEMYAEV